MMTASDRPRLTALGRILPTALQAAIRERTGGLDVATLLADLFRSYPPDDLGFDPVTTRRAFLLLDRTVCRYFRLQVLGTENIPAGRAMIVGCHSGVFAWDATCLVVAIYRHTGRFSRNVGDRFFGRLGPIVPFLKATGLVIGDPERVEACLRHDELVMAFPGGAADMLRPIWRRYQIEPHRGLAPRRGGYLKIALRAKSPIVPGRRGRHRRDPPHARQPPATRAAARHALLSDRRLAVPAARPHLPPLWEADPSRCPARRGRRLGDGRSSER
jgi:acyltransferase-like protein